MRNYLSSHDWDHYVDFATGEGQEPTREGFEDWADLMVSREMDRAEEAFIDYMREGHN